jgi:hypothetical protein
MVADADGFHHPADEAELVALVRAAYREGRQLQVRRRIVNDQQRVQPAAARSRHRGGNPRPSRPARPRQRRHEHRRRRPNPDALRDLAVATLRRASRPIPRPATGRGEHSPRTSPAANRRDHARSRPNATKRRVLNHSAALDEITATRTLDQNAEINPPEAPITIAQNPLQANTP